MLARNRQAAIERQLEAQSLLVSLVEARASAGAVASSEVAPFRTSRIRMQGDLALARAALVQATNRLAEVLGLPPRSLQEAQIVCSLESQATRQDNVAEIRAAALRNRSDILEMLARYEAAQAALQIEIAKQYPDVRLGSGYLWDQGESKWNLAVNFEVPLFNRNQGPIAEAEAHRAELAAQIYDLQAKASTEIDALIVTVKSAEEQAGRADEALAALKMQTDLVTQRLSAGGADQVELQTAVVDQFAAELVALDARARLTSAIAQLDAALQHPSPFISALFASFLSLP
jgi:outer membrane protein TolC